MREVVDIFRYGHLERFRNDKTKNFRLQFNQGGLPTFLLLYDYTFTAPKDFFLKTLVSIICVARNLKDIERAAVNITIL